MRNYKSSLLYMDGKNGEETKVTFNLPVKSEGDYKVYFYRPHPWNRDLVMPELINLEIKYFGGEQHKEISYSQNINNWAFVGTYNFDPATQNSVELT